MLDDDLLTRLREALGDDRVLTSDEDVDDRRHDYWVLSHLQSWRGTFEDRPGAVVRPRSTAEVQAVVRLAAETGTAVVPFGLGSGVCGGILPDRSMLLVDLSSMNRVRNIDEVNLVATFDAGVNGLVAEEAVAELGLTIGHWPQSIAVSTVGGWVSTRAAGQFSTAYGNIEDMVYSLEVVLPDGPLVNLGRAPRAAAGPDLRHTFMGAEGTMGIVTGVTLALHRQPEKRTWRVFHTPTLAAGLDAQRQIIVTSDRPPKDLSGLENRLVSRFEWGLVVDVRPPDYETRMAILRKKAADDGLSIGDEVIDLIAHSCTSSVRELEGAVIKLLAFSSLTHQEITPGLARTALYGVLGRHRDEGPVLSPERIRETVARRWRVRAEALASKRRTKDLTVPRQVAMYLIKETLDTSLVRIGELFGGRDHSTVIHSIRKVEDQMERDPVFREQVDAARAECEHTE